MKVCTSEEATAFNCYRMPKKCCGAQCMAWEETGDNGLCGALPKSEVMMSAGEIRHGADTVPALRSYSFPTMGELKSTELPPLTDDVIDSLTFAPIAQDLGQSHTPAPKHNKHKGGR
jgi:hypothetical protein